MDADQLAKQAMAEKQVAARLVHFWGSQVQTEHGAIDRQAVSRIVFGDRAELRRLEELIHPKVYEGRQRLHQQYRHASSVVAIVEDCPLLFEVGLDKSCDVTIFIEASRQVRQARLHKQRRWTDIDLARREKNQLPLDKKAKLVDYVIVNNASEAECFAHVRGVFSQIMNNTCDESVNRR